MKQVIYLRLYKAIRMVCSASFEKSTHLVFDERPMPKIALFQGVNESSRHKKARTNTVRAFFELEVMSQAVGLAKVTLEQAGESLAVASLVAGHLVHGVVDSI